MHDVELEAVAPNNLRAGVRVSSASIGWTAVSSTIAIILGVTSGSLVLLAFGFAGLFDAAGSLALVLHFRHALHHEAISEKHERVARQR